MTSSFQISTRYNSCVYGQHLLDQAVEDRGQDSGEQLQLLLEITAAQQLVNQAAKDYGQDTGEQLLFQLLQEITAVEMVNSSLIRQLQAKGHGNGG